MKIYSYYVIVLLFLTNSFLPVQSQSLLPQPQKTSYGKSKFQLYNAKILLSKNFSNPQKKAISQFVSFVKEHMKISLATTYSETGSAPLFVFNAGHTSSILPTPNEDTGKQSRESYQINVTPGKVLVTANADAGFYYALLTLRQLIKTEGKTVYIPEVSIEDNPAYAYRGVMMDLTHGPLLTESEIKKQIDFLSRWKMNQYYFYNEITIAMKGFPLINYRAKYSQEQVKRIIAYAKERYVDVIPFVELYGHMHELLRLEKYAPLGIGNYGHDMDPRNPGVQVLLQDWIKQYVELFPSPFIHIGFDETWETERLSHETDTTLVPKELYLDQLRFTANTLKQYGKTVMVWTDITKDYPDILTQFPKEVIPVVWEYSTDSAAMNKWIVPVTKEKLPFFVMSAVDGWCNIYPGEKSYGNIDLCLKAARDNKAIGYMTSVWTDAVQPFVRNSWLFMAYGCAGAWHGYPVERNEFINNYSKIEYPEISAQMSTAFKKMAEAQLYLEKCKSKKALGGIVEMWANPFSAYYLKNTNDHLSDYKNARLAAEIAQESLITALQYSKRDSAFIQTLIISSRLLQYTATRFLWAKNIVDRWNHHIKNGKESGNSIMFYDLMYSTHGFITDMLEYSSELKEEYRESWLSENMPYRLGAMTGRFDAEYLLWKNLHARVLDYQLRSDAGKPSETFEKTFK